MSDNLKIIHYDKLLLKLDDEENCTDDYEYSYEDSTICSFCGTQYKKSYITYIHDNKIKTKSCFLCHIICNFKKYHMGKAFLIKSELSQQKINNSTLMYYYKNMEIPLPTLIDSKSEIVAMSLFEYVSCLEKMDESQLESFSSYKIMFTGEIEPFLENGPNIFFNKDKKIKKEKYDISYFNIPSHTFPKKTQKIFNSVLIKLREDENESVNKINKSLTDKVNNSIDKNKFIETLLK